MSMRVFALLSCGVFSSLAFAQDVMPRFHAAERRFSFGTTVGPSLQHARFGLDVDGKTYWSDKTSQVNWEGSASDPGRLTLRFDEPGILWTIRLRRGDDGSSAIVTSTIRNVGGKPVRLGRCRLADLSDPAAELRLGAGAEKSVILEATGWGAPTVVRAVRDGGKRRVARTIAQMYNPVSKTALLIAFLSFDRIHTEHEVWWDEDRHRAASSSYCDFLGFSLAAGASIDSEELLIQIRRDPIESLIHWGDLARDRYHITPWPKIPAGWVGWSWVDGFYVERYEDVVRRNTRAIRERLPGLDIGYVWVSLGNLENITPGNWLHWNYKLFPTSPQKLVADLDRQDFRLGLWIAPFWLSGRVPEAEGLKDAFMLSGGKPLVIPRTDVGDTFVLDPTHPKTLAFLRHALSVYRQWGVRYYMLDFLNAVSGPIPGTYKLDGYADRSVVFGPQALREGLKMIRDAVGPDTYLLGGTGPSFQLVGLIDGMRTGRDYGEGRPLYGPGKWYYPATYVINKPDHWQGHRAAIEAMATAFFTHRKLFLSDSGNVLTIDKPLPTPDAQISATIFAINGGPLMLGDDIARMAPDRVDMIKLLFPRLPEAAVPVDLFDAVAPDYPKFFHLPVRREWDHWDLAAIFNFGDETLTQRVDFARLGIDSTKPQAVWDFWSERYLGVHTSGLTASIAPRSVLFLRLAGARRHPWILSTDMHARQGQAEIEDCRWDAERSVLSIHATRPVGYQGSVYVHVPKGFAFKNPAGLWIAKDGNDGTMIVRCPFDFSKSTHQTRVLEFVPDPGR
jgi:hypothetical protein